MRETFLSALAILAFATSLPAQESITTGRWITTAKYAQGEVVLHWTHVYEGKDTVYEVEVKPAQEKTTMSFKVEGQPVFNGARTHVAFPYCADDGCAARIDVLDLTRKRKLATIQLNHEGQFYVDASWAQNTLGVEVEWFPSPQSPPQKRTYYFFISSDGSISEQKQ